MLDEISTVNSILEAIEYENNPNYEALCDYSDETKNIVKQLDKFHAYNDDLFNVMINKVMSADDILTQYKIKI